MNDFRLGIFLILFSCGDTSKPVLYQSEITEATSIDTPPGKNRSGVRTIHVFVALCDNRYQGIVPVPSSLGNGQDPKNNLYWGAGAGVRTWLRRKDSEWKMLDLIKPSDGPVLEKLLFRHKTENVYLLAEAYDGKFIRQTTVDFLKASAGENVNPVIHDKDTIYFGGASNLLSYIGHNGLMDFDLREDFSSSKDNKRETIILACFSKSYFSDHLKSSGAFPLLWTTGLMAPEAYTLHDAVKEWIKGKDSEAIQDAAAQAYAKYQKCGVKAAKKLLVTGW